MTHALACLRWLLPLASVLCAACAEPSGSDTGSTTGTTSTDGAQTTGADDVQTTGADVSSSGSTTDDDASDSTGGSDPCAAPGFGDEPRFDATPGRFTLRAQPGYQRLTGFVSDGPRVEFHQESERQGACRLLTYTASTCDPACVAPAVCIAGACVSEPLGLSAGAVTLTGVGDQAIELTEDPLHNYFWESVADPAITMPSLAAAGADVDAFELSTCPTTAPTPTDDWSALLAARAAGEPVTLTWSDPVQTARIYLRMTTGIGTHGGISPVEIECEGPDVGMLELPGAQLDALYADGWACGECGGNDLVRYHVDEADAGGTSVQLRVEAITSFWFIP